MSYTPAWERLSDAVERVMRATGCSKDEAQTDIGQAIADRTVKFRGKLARHTTKRFTSPAILEGRDFELPSAIASTDLDWERSRPNKPWLVRRGAYPLPGYWDLEWIEVYGSDITNVVCLDGGKACRSRRHRSTTLPRRRGAQGRHLKGPSAPLMSSTPKACLSKLRCLTRLYAVTSFVSSRNSASRRFQTRRS